MPDTARTVGLGSEMHFCCGVSHLTWKDLSGIHMAKAVPLYMAMTSCLRVLRVSAWLRRPIECQHGATGLRRGDPSLNAIPAFQSTSSPPPWTEIRHDTLPIDRGTSYLAVAGLTVASWLIVSSPGMLRGAAFALAVLRLANIPPSSGEESR